MITSEDIAAALWGLGIEPSDTLFVHSDVRRCLRVAGDTREDKLATIVRALAGSVPDGTLIMPTFTYSFCRGELFDIRRSPSTVGVLTEYFRGLHGVRRTADPIFSTALLGRVPAIWEQRLFAVGDKDCFGERSVFAYLLETDAKLAFLGVDLSACTFIYHVEQRQRVPYRYFKDFNGLVADDSGARPVMAHYYVRDLDSDVELFLEPLARGLLDRGEAAEIRFERGPAILVTSARAIAAAAVSGLRENPSYLLERGHPEFANLPHA